MKKPVLSRTGFAAAFLALWALSLLTNLVAQPLLVDGLQGAVLLILPLLLWARLNDLGFRPRWLLFFVGVTAFSAAFQVSDYSLTFSPNDGWTAVALTVGLALSLSGFTYILLLALSAQGKTQPTRRSRRWFVLAVLFFAVSLALSILYGRAVVIA